MADYPLHALRRLLTDSSVIRGVVVSRADGRVQIATARGLQTVLAGGDLQIGQTVTARGGVAYAAAVASSVYAL